jgi:hypothetical protein
MYHHVVLHTTTCLLQGVEGVHSTTWWSMHPPSTTCRRSRHTYYMIPPEEVYHHQEVHVEGIPTSTPYHHP